MHVGEVTRVAEEEKLVGDVAQADVADVAVVTRRGHVTRAPVTVDEPPLAFEQNGRPRVAEVSVIFERHAGTVAGALRYAADDLHRKSDVAAINSA